MGNSLSKKCIYPDKNSWLSEILVVFLKTFENEMSLTLWDALNEYVRFHNPHCAYLGKTHEGEVFLYPFVDYDHDLRRATLRKMFYLSNKAKTIFTNDYLKIHGSSHNNTPFFNFLNRKLSDKYEDFPELEFMVMHNNMDPAAAKEILLKTSYERKQVQRLFIFENEALGIEYSSINVARIEFDLSFLDSCRFFEAERYKSFRELLPPNLVVPVSCRIDYDLPDIPSQLKHHQLLDVSSVDN